MALLMCGCEALKRTTGELNNVMVDLVCPLCNTKLSEKRSISRQAKLNNYLAQDENYNASRRNTILNELKKKSGTDRELARRLGFDDPNKVRLRRKELVDMDLVRELNKRACEVSGKTVTVWGV